MNLFCPNLKTNPILVFVSIIVISSCSIKVEHIPMVDMSEHLSLIGSYQDKGMESDLFDSYESLLKNHPEISEEPYIYYYLSCVEKGNHYLNEGLKKFPHNPDLMLRKVKSSPKDSVPILLKTILSRNPTHIPTLESFLRLDLNQNIVKLPNVLIEINKYRKEIKELVDIINQYNNRVKWFNEPEFVFSQPGFYKDFYNLLKPKTEILNESPVGDYYNITPHGERVVKESFVQIQSNGTWTSEVYLKGKVIEQYSGKWFVRNVKENLIRNPENYRIVLFQYDTKGTYSIKRNFTIYELKNSSLKRFKGELLNKIDPFFGIERILLDKDQQKGDYLKTLYETYTNYSNPELVFDKDTLITGILTSDIRSVLDLEKMKFSEDYIPFPDISEFYVMEGTREMSFLLK